MKVKKVLYTFTESVRYKEDQFPTQAEENRITAIDLMHVMNHSQTDKAKRLLSVQVHPNGRDMAAFCHHCNFDLLRFYQYNGHDFETDINDLYCLEMAGVKVADLIRTLGIEPIDRKAQPMSHKDHYDFVDRQKEQIKQAQANLDNIIERYADSQRTSITNQARAELTAQMEEYRQRVDREYKQKLEDRDQTILYLSRKLMEVERRINAARKYPLEDAPARMVADDTKIGER